MQALNAGKRHNRSNAGIVCSEIGKLILPAMRHQERGFERDMWWYKTDRVASFSENKATLSLGPSSQLILITVAFRDLRKTKLSRCKGSSVKIGAGIVGLAVYENHPASHEAG